MMSKSVGLDGVEIATPFLADKYLYFSFDSSSSVKMNQVECKLDVKTKLVTRFWLKFDTQILLNVQERSIQFESESTWEQLRPVFNFLIFLLTTGVEKGVKMKSLRIRVWSTFFRPVIEKNSGRL